MQEKYISSLVTAQFADALGMVIPIRYNVRIHMTYIINLMGWYYQAAAFGLGGP